MKPTARQLAYLRSLAQRTGETFIYPRTIAEARAEIERLKHRRSATQAERHADRRAVYDDLASRPDDATRVREHELDGYGSTATWKGDDLGPTDEPTNSKPKAGRRVELARYSIRAGERVLEGQRIGGVVRVTDRSADHDGRRYSVEQGLTSKAELDALVSDYIAVSTRRDQPAILVDLDATAAGASPDPEPAHA